MYNISQLVGFKTRPLIVWTISCVFVSEGPIVEGVWRVVKPLLVKFVISRCLIRTRFVPTVHVLIFGGLLVSSI